MDIDFYSVIGCKLNCSNEDIIKRYKEKIKDYEANDNYSQKIKNEIKILKIAKYVLTNSNLREKYDNILKNNYFEDQNDIRFNLENNTATRRDFKLELNDTKDALSDRVFQKFDFD